MDDPTSVTTFLFTDIEGSTRLWEQEPERMREALARHDALGRRAVETNRGIVVKTTGDGLHAAFDDPCDGIAAVLAFQRSLADPRSTAGFPLRVRCGLHTGVVQRRDHDYFGTPVNRAARIMGIAHGGQVLVSHATVDLVGDRLPPDVTLRDLGTVHLRDLSGAERVYQLVHPDLRSDFPALRSLESTPNNLPQQLTSFIGRERVLVEVRTLLRGTRLLTLCGAGGLGKTRLSLQVAADALSGFANGTWFVDLAPVADPRLVPQTVASVLGVKEEAGHPMTDALLRFVKDRELLLILDNCEHVVDACARLATELLQGSTKLKVLATSREALSVRGETLYPVPALAVPETGQKVAVASLTEYESVQLFVDRATAVQPTFRLGERNAEAVAEICRRLDGIPLAIELAAARLRSLSVEAIASRLGDLFRLLVTGDRAALPRQQTLRALIDWSHELLSPDERAVFRRLAVFAGGWTIEAAEAVCADGDVAREDVLDLLSSLVDKSLVAVDHESGRYRLLEAVRQYADEKLRHSDEDEATRERHLRFHLALAESARPGLLGPDQKRWLGRLDLERENLLAAHAACARNPRTGAVGLQFVTALKNYFLRRGLITLARQVMEEAISHAGAQARTADRSRALVSLGQIAWVAGHYADARRRLEESLAIARELGDEKREAAVLQPLGVVLSSMGDLAEARRCYDDAILLASRIGDLREVAMALNSRAQLHQLERKYDEALPLLERVLSITRELQDHENIALALLNVAMVEIARGKLESSHRCLAEALELAEQTDSQFVGQSVLEVCSGLAASCGDLEEAARLFGIAEAEIARTGQQRSAADDAFLKPLMENARERLGAPQFDRLAAGPGLAGLPAALVEVRRWLTTRPGAGHRDHPTRR